jgi:hypothetical protein
MMKKELSAAQYEWKLAKDELVFEMRKLGHPEEFAILIAKNLGSPKAIRRMSSYLRQVKPKKPEMIADEMLAIMSEIDSWKRKKEAEAANAAYNDLLLRGLDD